VGGNHRRVARRDCLCHSAAPGSSFNDPDIVTCLAELGPVTGGTRHLEPTCHRTVRPTKLVFPCHQTTTVGLGVRSHSHHVAVSYSFAHVLGARIEVSVGEQPQRHTGARVEEATHHGSHMSVCHDWAYAWLVHLVRGNVGWKGKTVILSVRDPVKRL
jgi:hypothetical protein